MCQPRNVITMMIGGELKKSMLSAMLDAAAADGLSIHKARGFFGSQDTSNISQGFNALDQGLEDFYAKIGKPRPEEQSFTAHLLEHVAKRQRIICYSHDHGDPDGFNVMQAFCEANELPYDSRLEHSERFSAQVVAYRPELTPTHRHHLIDAAGQPQVVADRIVSLLKLQDREFALARIHQECGGDIVPLPLLVIIDDTQPADEE